MGRLENVIGTNIIVTPDGDEIRLGHTWHEVDVLTSIIQSICPYVFFEIGVHEGGLSYLLLPKLSDLSYFGIEIYCDLVRPAVKMLYQTSPWHVLLCSSCFSDSIRGEFATRNRKIIYCDGGDKPKELEYFKGLCYSGDYIFTHDFYDGNRKVRDVPDENISKEVLPIDIVHMETDPTFVRYDEDTLKETRIVGWRKK